MSEAVPLPVVLLVDDDEVFRPRLARALRNRGWEVLEAADHQEAIAAARAEGPECAVVDLRLPDKSGLSVVKELIAQDPAIAVLVLTGYGSIATALEAIRLGAIHYLTKPATVDDILAGFQRGNPAGTPGAEAEDETPDDASDEVPSLARVEWEHINRVLQDCEGNVSEAARRLGIHRRSLQRKLAKRPVRR